MTHVDESRRHILVTGITGNLGAHTALRLLAEGHVVYALCRGRSFDPDPAQRVMRSLAALAEDPSVVDTYKDRLIIIPGVIGDAAQMATVTLPRPVDETWHFASSLKFMPKDREQILNTNVDGLRHVMDLHARAAKKDAPFFYIGTAYIGGKGAKLVPEHRIRVEDVSTFHNTYENSKLIAENMILDAIESGALRGAIFRPSIVLGDASRGKLINYHGYYLMVKACLALDNFLHDEGRTDRMILRLASPAGCSINFIYIDDVTDQMHAIRKADWENGGVYNIAHPTEVTLVDFAEVISAQLRHVTIRCVELEEFEREPRSYHEKLFMYSTTYTAPYVMERIRFDLSRSSRLLGELKTKLIDRPALARINEAFFQHTQEQKQ